MAEPERFYVVCEADVAGPIARTFAERADAERAAQALAVNNQGATFVVLEPVEAYRSSKPRAEKVYLSYPAREAVEQPPTVETVNDPVEL